MKRLALSLAMLLTAWTALAAEPRPPNFVVIFIDDMGYADIGPFGATKQKTPNLDRMAREGMKLTSFYAAPVCSVSRAQLMTGCYGARVSVPGVFFPGQAEGLHPDEQTMADRLKALGYATMCIGKWHLGDQPQFLPTKQGFDHYLGIPYSNDMQKRSTDKGIPVVPLLRDDRIEELLTDEQQSGIVERYTDEAVKFLHASKDRPFLLYMPHTAVHTPIHPGEKFRGKSANGRFGDWVEEVDWSVGRVLDTLRELKLEQQTLVIFTSDNGPWLVKASDGGSALPLRGGKGSTWEGGVRVPTLAWWPGRVPEGSACDAVAGTIDLTPTFVTLAGGTIAPEPVIDGRDISKLLLGRSKESAREAHYYFAGYTLQAVRQGPWKLAFGPQKDVFSGGAEDTSGVRLYNLDEEIGEQTNVADNHPDVVAKLKALAEHMAAEIGGKEPKARRPAGIAENPRILYHSDAPTGPRRAAASSARSLSALKLGGSLAGDAAPQVARKGFTLSCTIDTTATDGVIVAHGGAQLGYALYLREGKPVFSIRVDGEDKEVVAREPVKGETKLRAALSADGTMTLQAGAQEPVTGKGVLLPKQPAENFCLGHDDARPVAHYKGEARFRGRIADVDIKTE